MFRILISTALAFLLTACAATAPQVQHLYEGPKQSASALLTLTVPAEIEVLAINQRALATTAAQFLGGTQQTYLLSPGTYTVTGYYKELWLDHEESHHMVRSQPVDFTVEGSAGDTVMLDYKAAHSLEEAQALAKNFSGQATNLRTQASLPSTASEQKRPGLFAGNSGPVMPKATTVEPSAQPSPTTPEGSSDLLPLLKAYWNEASGTERRAFLEWIAR